MKTPKESTEIRIWFSGAEGVGKSSYLTKNAFKFVSNSDNLTLYSKRYRYEGHSYTIKAVECSLNSIEDVKVNTFHVMAICFDISDRASLGLTKEYIQKIKKMVPPDMIICLIGTYADVQDRPKVSKHELAYY